MKGVAAILVMCCFSGWVGTASVYAFYITGMILNNISKNKIYVIQIQIIT